MALNVGTTPISKLYVGATPVSKLYQGSSLLWTAGQTLPAAPARTIEAWAVRGNDTDQYFGPFTLGASTNAEAADPLWVKSGLRFDGTDFLRGDAAPYQVHEQTHLYLMAPTAQDAMMFTVADNWNVKTTTDGFFRFEYKRSSGSYFTQNGPALAPNKVQIAAIRKSVTTGLKLSVNQAVTNYASETSQIGFNTDFAYFGRHANNSLYYTGNVLGYLYFNRALTDAEYTQAYNYMVAYAQQNLGVNLGDAPDNTPLPTFYPVVKASSAKEFTEAITVAGHLEWTEYINNWPTLKTRIIDSGITQFRGVWPSTDGVAKAKELIAGGVKVSIAVDPNPGVAPRRYNADGTLSATPYWRGTQSGQSWNLLALIDELGPQNVAFVAGINEPDLFVPSKWTAAQTYNWERSTATNGISVGGGKHAEYVQYLKEIHRDTRRDLNSDPRYANIKFIGIAFASSDVVTWYTELGDMSAHFHAGNSHTYMAARNPEHTGFGDNGYGSMAQYHRDYLQRKQMPSGPFASDEGSWATSELNNDETLRAKYMLRYYTFAWQQGFRYAITAYDWLSHSRSSDPRENSFGRLNADLTPKLTYTLEQRFLGLLKDPGAVYTTGNLPFSFTGSTADLQTVLLQKRDGSFWLLVWLSKRGQNPDTKADEPVASQSVTLNLSTAKNINRYAMLVDSNVKQSATGATAFTFNIADTTMILEIR